MSNLTSIGRNTLRVAFGALAAVALGVGGSAPADAAPCAGFTDVESTDPFCPNVEWLKNRAITLGCTAVTLYCPKDAVSRLAMAAFMNRLGTALTPVQVRVDTVIGWVDLDGAGVVCQTGDFSVAGFPRRAYVDLSMTAIAAAEVDLAADVAMTTDGGASWVNLNTVPNRGSLPAGRWGGLSDIAYVDLAVGQTVRWGVKLTRGGVAGTADLLDARCQLRSLVYSRDGAASPY